MTYKLSINGKTRTVDAPADMPLLWVLRDELGLVGTKFGCGVGLCGACTVHLNGEAVRACQTPVGEVKGGKIVTIEAVGDTLSGAAIQQAWLALDVMQCGYCQAGQIMTAAALLKKNPHPSMEQIDSAMHGNLCRCCAYHRIREAVKLASTKA